MQMVIRVFTVIAQVGLVSNIYIYIYCGMMSLICGTGESSNQMKIRCLLA